MINLSDIKLNPNNPRYIKDEQFEKLVKSIRDFPRMLELRPIVIDSDGVIVGGNMRYRALLEIGYKEVDDSWIKKADDFTPEELREFVIKDNLTFGSWDWDELANNWDVEELSGWGLEIPDFEGEAGEGQKDLSDKIQEGFTLEIKLKSESDCQELFERLTNEGYSCRILTF
jgi:ParB-like chromosome segregation protein Spo0J